MVNPAKLIYSLKKRTKQASPKVPNHIAFAMQDQNKKKTHPFSAHNKLTNINRIIASCVRLDIPLTTFYVLPFEEQKSEHFQQFVTELSQYLEALSLDQLIHDNQIRISVIGKWYDLPGRTIDSIKKIVSSTQNYDKFFVNLCINYDGKQEIIDACRLFALRVKADKIDPTNITESALREGLYTSYFLPPNLIIHTNNIRKLTSLLLWDSVGSILYVSPKPWCDFSHKELHEAINYYQKVK